MAKKVKKATKKKAPAVKKAASAKKGASGKKSAPKALKRAKMAAPSKKLPKKSANVKKTIKKAPKAPALRSSAPKDEKLTPEEIEGYRRLLLEKMSELLGDVTYIEDEALRKSRLDAAGDLSSMPIHMADLGTDNFEQEFALGLMDSERKILGEIVAALRRITDGTFGICEGTGKNISKARLQASPWARYCIDYARMVEKGLITEGERVYVEPETDAVELFDDEADALEEDFGEADTDETPYDEEDEPDDEVGGVEDFDADEEEEGEEDVEL